MALNRTVPLAMVSGPGAALAKAERLERDERLSGYHYLPAIKADLLSRLGRTWDVVGLWRGRMTVIHRRAGRPR